MARTLGQAIATVKTAKAQAASTVAQVIKTLSSGTAFNGMVRTYEPATDGGQQLPAESVRLQQTGPQVLERLFGSLESMFDAVFNQELGDQVANASVRVGGVTLIANAPVTYLLWMEKELTGLAAVLKQLPTLDPAHQWVYDEPSGTFRTAPVRTARKEKVKTPVTLFAGDEHHAPQVTLVDGETIAGYWVQSLISGGYTQQGVTDMAWRVNQVLLGVRLAREEANRVEVADNQVARGLLDYIRSGS